MKPSSKNQDESSIWIDLNYPLLINFFHPKTSWALVPLNSTAVLCGYGYVQPARASQQNSCTAICAHAASFGFGVPPILRIRIILHPSNEFFGCFIWGMQYIPWFSRGHNPSQLAQVGACGTSITWDDAMVAKLRAEVSTVSTSEGGLADDRG